MNVIISSRHCNPPRAVRRSADDRMRRLTRYEPRLIEAAVNFDHDHGENRVEVRLSIAGVEPVVADATGETFRAALNRVARRVDRQLRRLNDRRHDHQAAKPLHRRPPVPHGGP